MWAVSGEAILSRVYVYYTFVNKKCLDFAEKNIRRLVKNYWRFGKGFCSELKLHGNIFCEFFVLVKELVMRCFCHHNSRMCWHSTVRQNACRFIMNLFTIVLDYLVYIRYIEKVSGGYSICIYGIWYMTKK